MSLETLKLNKQLNMTMKEAGFSAPTEIQSKAMSRILGGQDLIGIGPEGCGKTTTYVLGILMKLKHAFEVAPRAMVLVETKERALEVEEEFERFNRYSDIRTISIYPGLSMDSQRDDLFDGVDVVIGTPDRIQSLLLQSGINVNKVKTFVLDNSDALIKQGFQTAIWRIAEGLNKSQHIIFGESAHEKLDKLVAEFINYPTKIEVTPELENKGNYLNQNIYQVPNFATKQNLLKLLLSDYEDYRNVVVFVNTRLTAGKLYSILNNQFHEPIAMIKPLFFDPIEFDSIDTFLDENELRVLLVANEDNLELNLSGVGHIVHFDLPENIDIVISRLQVNEQDHTKALSFATDLELPLIKKIEVKTGQEVNIEPLPEDLKIEGQRKKTTKKVEEDPTQGGAFHEKSAKNSKDYNYGTKDRRKMKGKVSKRKNY